MSAENNKAVVRRFFEELCNQRKLDVADDIFTLNHTYHDPSSPQVGQGPNEMKKLMSIYQTAFPDAHWTIDEMLVDDGDTVVTRWTGRGTHTADLPGGISATSKKAVVQGIWINRLSNDKIVESWNVWDTLGMLQQLGIVPTMG